MKWKEARAGAKFPPRVFDALEWIAAWCRHVPGRGEQMVRYGACPPLAELLLQCCARKRKKA
ncbi:hypothetical protein ACFL0M_11655 [Thermodesulfobacteriota bacterium]